MPEKTGDADATQTHEASQAQPPAQGKEMPGIWESIQQNPTIPLIIIGIWVLFIWTNRKNKGKVDERKTMLEGLKKGDKIITIGGIHGEIVSLTKETMTIKTDPKSGATATFDREALRKLAGGESKEEDKQSN